VNIFEDTFRFTLLDGGNVDTANIEKKIGEPDQFTTYLEGMKHGEWTVFGNYTGNINSLSYDGANGHIMISVVPFKNNVIRVEKPGQMETTIAAKRIVSVWDSSGVRAFYVSLIMGREKL
jgi:CTP:phosphocholine cytidylyltransferase-like protein